MTRGPGHVARRLHRSLAFHALAAAVLALAAIVAQPHDAMAMSSLAGIMAHSPDDISGFSTLTGDNNTVSVTLPFTFTVEGASFTTIVLSTNGWIEFGANTSGSSNPSNDCLPTPDHTNPFLAAYWDDLVPWGSNIRYGTVGQSPNRVFIVDLEADVVPSNQDLRYQVQLHEGSNLITVRYRDTQNQANGQGATIGFQGAGGASATTVQPLTCNGKILDDNRPNEGWSADVGRAGLVTLAAVTMHSPDDISGFSTLTGDENTVNVTLPFSVTLEGTSYSTLTLSSNGWIEFGTNTSGGADFNNGCLPVANHTNPFLAAYWDDMNPFGTSIRYGTVGTSPNRTFIADYELDTFNGEGSDDVRFQVQIHERSSLISVRYRDAQHLANGQLATIGFQGAGGAGAASYPISCNAKVLDDNQNDRDGWSVHPKTLGAMSLHSILAHSPDDISGFTTLTGDNSTASVSLPFNMSIDGTNYGTIVISTNGWIEFGSNTSGGPDPNNGCLPTSSHTNPFLAAYWDDMSTASTNIRYGTVGTSPNRVFIADFYLLTTTGGDDSGGDDIAFQVELHEASNTIGVKSYLSQHVANGQSATIGFQGAGGASATAYPLTCNGKILDDNRPGEGWSIAPLPICGNSLVETKEQCDLGGSNGSGTSCCTSVCGFRSAGQTCRTSAGVCDVAETCTGSSASCPADGFQSSATVCRGSAGVCDVAENCTGSSAACPADGFVSSATTCRSSAGVCDVAENCTGAAAACPADGFVSSATTCRASGGVCDVAENCTGSSAGCPADGFVSSATTCRGSAGVCDIAENCTGSSAACPADGFVSSATTCRSSAGVCDVAENCTGSGATCPADAFQSSTTTCRGSAGVCDVAENCTGSGAACPTDGFQSSATTCRSSAGVCDVAESCTGSAAACPADAFESSATVCRGAAGVCDLAENCTGSGAACPSDAKSTAECRAAAGVCDIAETCDGVTDDCPADAFEPSTTECRASAGICDLAESCTGSGAACPADAKSTAVCRASAGVCDLTETCDGVNDACPADAFEPATTECRAAAGVCDLAENCTGSGAACPADAKSTAECRASTDVCDVAESCDGVTDDCPTDGFEPATTECRASAGICDVAENCTGSSAACPSDAFEPGTTECRASAGVCDIAESCTGSGAACPSDGFEPATTECRASAGVCDITETCDGMSDACPADAFEPTTTECRPSVGVCDLAESCTGAMAACPTDAKSNAVCRPSAGICDVAETCDGVSDACPPEAFEPGSTECRASAGVCDVAESCTGLGAACPADTLVPASTTCRAAAGVCDVTESCDGVNGACPSDTKSNAVCRPSADVCDVTETCDGVNDACPADAFEPSSIQCRGSAGVCDIAESCTGSSAACPTDAFEPSSTVCRPDAGDCDMQETCTGGAACPADGFEPFGTGCSDGNVCTTLDVCDGLGECVGDPQICGDGVIQASCGEQCDDGNTNDNDGCSSSCQTESFCEPAPTIGCRPPDAPNKALFMIKDRSSDGSDQMQWKYVKGAVTPKADFGDPPGGTDYAFCVYDQRGLISSALIPGNSFCNTSPCWREKSDGYQYQDRPGSSGGVIKMKLKQGLTPGKTKIQLKLKGFEIDMPTLPLQPPAIVQLRNSDGVCWEGTYTPPFSKNTPDTFKDKAD